MIKTLNAGGSAEEISLIFFRNVKRVLGISSTQAMVGMVGKVLTHVCRSLSKQEVNALVSRLPGIFQHLLCKEITMTRQHLPLTHLDELVESIYEDDRNSEHPQFSTEVQALDAVVVILRKLDKYLNIFSYNILNPRWVEGLRQIPLEDAA